MWLQIIFSIFFAYLIGSIPSAFILVRWIYKQDITGEGSGNVGSLNVLRTTKSKTLAFVVLILDFSKGLIVILLANYFYTDQMIVIGILAIIVVLGHNYPIWLNFHGGRGLATSAGVVIVLAPIILGIWIICWFLTYFILRQIIFASVISTFVILIFLWWPGEKFAILEAAFPISIISVMILIKHISRIKQVWLSSIDDSVSDKSE